jgi:poly-gamma-glutamate synthesis protein (capsule biosynthesis protein)
MALLWPVAAASGGPTVTIVAVGDICLAGGVERSARREDAAYPFRHMVGTLRGADIAIGNLECALTERTAKLPKRYNFRASRAWADRLRRAGFDALSLANNHTFDYGRQGLADTLGALRASGIEAPGGGLTAAEARRPRILVRHGVRVALLAYLGLFPPLVPFVPDAPGVAMAYDTAVAHDVASAARTADVVVVSLHAGKEMVGSPTWRQRSLAAAALDAGADVVIGHHPHVVQPLAWRKGKPIFYSLGNFVFNPSPSFLRYPKRPWSALARIAVDGTGVPKAELVPLRIVNRQPRLAQR